MTLTVHVWAQKERAWMPKTFPISFWCGPPDAYITPEQYKRIAEAGFTVVMPPCEGEASVARNRKILELARQTGLKAVIQDSRMPLSLEGKPEREAAIKAIVSEYKRYPALLGYFLTDEPGANQFVGLAEVAQAFKKYDPDHLVYINLFPNYASTDRIAQPSQLNADSYDEYLDRYMKVVAPDVLSWDHYHFLKDSDREGFFGNLYSAQRAAAATSPPTPLWQIVLSVQHGPYRALTENELRYEAMQTLVFGAQGLVYFTYWLPQDDGAFHWSHSIMNRDGTPGPLYAPVKAVNREVQALAKSLYGATIVRTFQTGTVPPDGHGPPDDVPIKVEGGANLSVGVFRGAKGFLYILLTNRDYRKPTTVKVTLSAGKRAIERLDTTTERWGTVTGQKNMDGDTTLDVDFGPAGAVLIRWQ